MPLIALAQAPTLKNPFSKFATLQEFLCFLVEVVQLVATPALVICIIYAGFLFVTASGNEDQITRAKRWLLWTLVGATIVLSAKVLVGVAYGTAKIFDGNIVVTSCP
jgi:hypothetical protein